MRASGKTPDDKAFNEYFEKAVTAAGNKDGLIKTTKKIQLFRAKTVTTCNLQDFAEEVLKQFLAQMS